MESILFKHPEIKSYISEKTKDLPLKKLSLSADKLLKPFKDRLKLKRRDNGNPFSSNHKNPSRWYHGLTSYR